MRLAPWTQYSPVYKVTCRDSGIRMAKISTLCLGSREGLSSWLTHKSLVRGMSSRHSHPYKGPQPGQLPFEDWVALPKPSLKTAQEATGLREGLLMICTEGGLTPTLVSCQGQP